MVRKLTPRELLESPSSSDEEALGLLFQDVFCSYEKSLLALAYGLCKNKQTAQDIVHDVFVKLWEMRYQLHEIRSIEAFLLTMTRNKVMDHLRKAASEARLREAIWNSMQGIVEDQQTRLEEQEYRTSLDRAIENLPDQRKTIYKMRADGHNYQEISDKLNISKHTVKNQISASIKAIRKVLSRFTLFF